MKRRWAEHFAGRRNLPIFIAHGRADGVLPFAIMERFQARLKAVWDERHLAIRSTAATESRTTSCAR